VLDLIVRDPRLTLARGSLLISLAGIWILGNTFTGRPVTVDITKTFAAKKGGKNGIIAFEWLADNSKRFVRIQRSLSTVWRDVPGLCGAGGHHLQRQYFRVRVAHRDSRHHRDTA
jgi:hypothetical protein